MCTYLYIYVCYYLSMHDVGWAAEGPIYIYIYIQIDIYIYSKIDR